MPVSCRPSQPAELPQPAVAAAYLGGLALVGRVDPVLDQVAGLGLDHGLVHGCSPSWWSCARVVLDGGGSDLAEQDVAADGPGLELDVVLALLRGSDALDVRADGAGDGVDVGPHRGAAGDADLDVAAGALEADAAAPGGPDGEVAAARGQGDVVVR